jgi:hypothetical protein
MTNKNKQPTHSIFQVIEREKNVSIWSRIGAAWAHQEGDGFNLVFNAIPLTGRVVLLKKDTEEKEA